MYRAILLVLYLLILTPTIIHLVRYRYVPGSRRVSVGLGAAGLLLAPTFATFLCELIVSVFSIILLMLIIIGGIGMLLRSVFR